MTDASQPLFQSPPSAPHRKHYDVEAKLIDEAFARKPASLLMTVVVALIGAALLWRHVVQVPLLVWLAAILALTALGGVMCLWFRRAAASGQRPPAAKALFTAQAIGAGAAWGLGPTLFLWQGMGTMAVMLVGTLLCVCAVAMTSIAGQKTAMQGFVLAALVPPAISAWSAGGTSEHMVAVMLLLGAVTLVKVGRDSCDTLRTSLAAQVHLQAILDTSRDAVVGMDAQRCITAWNQRAQSLFGWREEEVLGHVVDDLILEPVPGTGQNLGLAGVMKEAAVTGTNRRVEMIAKHRDGHACPVEVDTARLIVGGRTVMTAFVSDLSERRAFEDNLALFRRVFDASRQCVVIADASGRGIYQNRAHVLAMGYSDQEIVGTSFVHALPQEVAGSLWPKVKQSVATTGVWEGQLPMRRKDGSQFTSVSSIGSIKDAAGKIQYIFNIFFDFSDELARRNELSAAKEAAESASLAKSDFLSSMSHELRTPLNAILGFAQILEFDDALTAEQRESTQEIIKGGHHLLGLINEVLDLAKIESGHVTLSIENVRLKELIDDCRRLMQPLAAAAQLTMHVQVSNQWVVRADRARLKQVILNLLSNAIKYNRQGGDIGVRVLDARAERIRIEVTDTGLGIAQSRLPDVFQAFNRLGKDKGVIEGTGIGLSITRNLVVMMDGEVGVESQPGVGTTFWIELPRGSISMAGELESSAFGSTRSKGVGTGRCVLCIDDNPVNLKLIAQILIKRPGIDLVTAHSPGLGIQLAMSRQPELILLDINMPGMDGYQVLEVLKSYARTKSIPIIAVTANAIPRDIEKGGTAGLEEYLTKPLDVSKFLAAVDRCLAGSAELSG
jgi:PAS domain S-box-containing protein